MVSVKRSKEKENRVALTPSGAAALVGAGHIVTVQSGAGLGSGFDDEQYRAADAAIGDAASCWDRDLVVKVKEPLESEYPLKPWKAIKVAYRCLPPCAPWLEIWPFGNGLEFVQSTTENIAQELADTDLLIGAVLLAGARTPRVVSDAMVRTMQPGSVIVDVSIDQGGCIETFRPTSHSDPVYERHGVIHYCVTNTPGAYPRTSTLPLTQATLPYILKPANFGWFATAAADPGFAKAINTCHGFLANLTVAEALGRSAEYKELPPE